MTEPVRTVFLGSGGFAVPIVRALQSAPEVDLTCVITAPPRPAKRGMGLVASPVGEWAAATAVPQLTPRRLRDAEALDQLRELDPALLVLADYGRLVPGDWLALPAHGALNVHPSLLPRHRGAAPIPAAILSGDLETGVTLMRMDEGLDTGPIIARVRVPLHGDEVAPELEERLSEDGARLLRDNLAGWLDGTLPADPTACRRCHAHASAHARGGKAGSIPAGGAARAPGAGIPAVARVVPGGRRRPARRVAGVRHGHALWRQPHRASATWS